MKVAFLFSVGVTVTYDRKYFLSDALFAGQVVGLAIYGISQGHRMLTSVQGVSMSMFMLFCAFVWYVFILSWRAHRTQPSRVTWQILAGHCVGITMVTTFTLMLCWYLITGKYIWVKNDNLTVGLAVAGSAVVLGIGKANGYSSADPIVRGWLASCCKALPQAFLAWKIWHVGGSGFAATAIWIAHCTTMIRLGQLALSLREATWDRNRIGILISEVTNEMTWIAVTVAWLHN